MSAKTNKVEAITKKEIVRSLSRKTGFTQYNCSKLYDAVIEVFTETILSGRAIPMIKFGRIEPFTRPERFMYYLDNDTGIKLDENGEKMSYIIPPTHCVKFHTANNLRMKLNPGIYNEPQEVDISGDD